LVAHLTDGWLSSFFLFLLHYEDKSISFNERLLRGFQFFIRASLFTALSALHNAAPLSVSERKSFQTSFDENEPPYHFSLYQQGRPFAPAFSSVRFQWPMHENNFSQEIV